MYIPRNVMDVHSQECHGCTFPGMSWMYIPRNVMDVHSQECHGCTFPGMSWMYIPRNVMDVHSQECHGCTFPGMSWMYIPRNVMDVHSQECHGCTFPGMSWMYIPRNVMDVHSQECHGCTVYTSRNIRHSCTFPGMSLMYSVHFLECHGLLHVYIPRNVMDVNSQECHGCTVYTSRNIRHSCTFPEMSLMYSVHFLECHGLLHVYIPRNVMDVHSQECHGCTFPGMSWMYIPRNVMDVLCTLLGTFVIVVHSQECTVYISWNIMDYCMCTFPGMSWMYSVHS